MFTEKIESIISNGVATIGGKYWLYGPGTTIRDNYTQRN